MSNQTQIPVIQTTDGNLTQLQQNTNKVLRNIYNQIVSANAAIYSTIIIGEIKFSPLTLAQFQSTAGDTWIVANGQSCVGSIYSSLYGVNTVPNISVTGTNAFIKVN